MRRWTGLTGLAHPTKDGGWQDGPLLARGGLLERGSLSRYLELRSSGGDAEAGALIRSDDEEEAAR